MHVDIVCIYLISILNVFILNTRISLAHKLCLSGQCIDAKMVVTSARDFAGHTASPTNPKFKSLKFRQKRNGKKINSIQNAQSMYPNYIQGILEKQPLHLFFCWEKNAEKI